jgi:deoxyribose-phosphate aldolase
MKVKASGGIRTREDAEIDAVVGRRQIRNKFGSEDIKGILG